MRQPGSALRTAATCSFSKAASASPLPFAARIFATTVSTSAIVVLRESLLSPVTVREPVELRRVVVRELSLHVRRQMAHLLLDDPSRVRPGAVGVRIVRRPEQVAFAVERKQRHRHVIFLEREPDLTAKHVARLQREMNAAALIPVLLAFV